MAVRFVSDDVVDILHHVNIGRLGETLFVAPPLPIEPDFCVTVWDTGSSSEPDPHYLKYNYPTFQVRVRSKKESRIEVVEIFSKIRDVLHNWKGIVGDSRYLYIMVLSEVAHIGYDELSRASYSMNFKSQRVPCIFDCVKKAG